MPCVQGANLEANLRLVEHIKTVAQRIGCTPGQVAIAWLYRRAAELEVDMVAIPGTKRVKYLEENVAALEVKLSGDDYAHLCTVFASDAVAGERYAAAYLQYKKD